MFRQPLLSFEGHDRKGNLLKREGGGRGSVLKTGSAVGTFWVYDDSELILFYATLSPIRIFLVFYIHLLHTYLTQHNIKLSYSQIFELVKFRFQISLFLLNSLQGISFTFITANLYMMDTVQQPRNSDVLFQLKAGKTSLRAARNNNAHALQQSCTLLQLNQSP